MLAETRRTLRYGSCCRRLPVYLTALGLLTLLSLVAIVVSPSQAAEKPCVVIDSDAGLDDYRALAVLAPNRRVAAVVTTEGLARPAEGARAMREFMKRTGLSIPVIVGASPNTKRPYQPDPRLPGWRVTSETLNGLLRTETAAASEDIAAALEEATAGCKKVELLVIGPWTSFLRYASRLLPKVEKIVVQGRPEPDEPEGGPAGFNCTYDHESCRTAFDLLVGRQRREGPKFRANWVDIPNGPESCGSAEPAIDQMGRPRYAFSPSESWIKVLRDSGGLAPVVADILASDPKGWAETSLWDDLAALFMLRPQLFAVRRGHLEPCLSAEVIRKLIADEMSGKKK